jgi:hypothetical protein
VLFTLFVCILVRRAVRVCCLHSPPFYAALNFITTVVDIKVLTSGAGEIFEQLFSVY